MVMLTKHEDGGIRRKCSAAVVRRFIFEQEDNIRADLFWG